MTELAWWRALIRLRPLQAIFLAAGVALTMALEVAVFPLLGHIINQVAAGSTPGITAVLAVIGCAAFPTLLAVATGTLARSIQLDLLAAGRLSVIDEAIKGGRRAAAERAEDITQWWFRECIPQATNLLRSRTSAIVAFGFLASWHWAIAIGLVIANLLNGWAYQRWITAGVDEHDVDTNARRDLLHAATRGRSGELLHYRAYGFLANRYGVHALKAIAKGGASPQAGHLRHGGDQCSPRGHDFPRPGDSSASGDERNPGDRHRGVRVPHPPDPGWLRAGL